MKTRLNIFCICLSIAVSSIVAQAPSSSLKVVPEVNDLWLLEGSALKLDCIYTRPKDVNPQTFDFYFNGVLVENDKNGFQVTTNAQVFNLNDAISTLTLRKNLTKSTDAGTFECKTDTGNLESRISVHLFSVSLTNDNLREGAKSLSLQCVPEGLNPTDDILVAWMRDGKNITTDSKYIVHAENKTLEINDPDRADMGEYICEIVFNAGHSEEHRVRPQPLFVGAPPAIVSSSKDKNMVQGEQLDLTCKVSGYPFPTVEWRKDNQEFNTSTRIHITPYEGSPTGKLTIYTLDFDDKGTYSCIASSPKFENETATAEMVIRVKDKLAALWPFLGIVAEVIVLCAIILIYEKRKSKQMQDEDDSPDANEDEKKDHKDVRHRRT